MPQWLDHPQHEADVDGAHGQRADHREGITFKRTGSFEAGLYAMAGCALISAIVTLIAVRAPRRQVEPRVWAWRLAREIGAAGALRRLLRARRETMPCAKGLAAASRLMVVGSTA